MELGNLRISARIVASAIAAALGMAAETATTRSDADRLPTDVAVVPISLQGEEPASVGSDDAALVYGQAARLLERADAAGICSPASSNLVYPSYPPYGDAWMKMEQADYQAGADVRKLVRQASGMKHAAWASLNPQNGGRRWQYLNGCRNIANEIGDAALYQSVVLHDEQGAFDSIGDVLHLGDLLQNEPGVVLVRFLVSEGIQALAMSRLTVMISNVTISADSTETTAVPVPMAQAWIGRLLDHPDAQAQLDRALKGEPGGVAANPVMKPSLARALETARRVLCERDLTAMSLAAHVFQFKHGRWPGSLDDLKTEMPRLPLDPWGDGKQTLGYVLIKGALRGGADRPLVYSRCGANDGLFYRTDAPQYSYYNSDGSQVPQNMQKHGGQFRDVVRWAPVEGQTHQPTTMPVP
jgi:hypothetical protein